jgi:hypothetical protein
MFKTRPHRNVQLLRETWPKQEQESAVSRHKGTLAFQFVHSWTMIYYVNVCVRMYKNPFTARSTAANRYYLGARDTTYSALYAPTLSIIPLFHISLALQPCVQA